jgi:septum formation protein
MKKTQIILASASPQRAALLKKWGLSFKISIPNIKEIYSFKRPSYIVRELAYKKAKVVADKNPNSLIISADTIVVLKNHIIGKPKNIKDSINIIKSLNGSRHRVYSGIAIIDNINNNEYITYDCAVVKMKKLPNQEIRKLFGKHLDKAGSYAIQDTKDNFVDKIYGDYYTVIGLPYSKLKTSLKHFNIHI